MVSDTPGPSAAPPARRPAPTNNSPTTGRSRLTIPTRHLRDPAEGGAPTSWQGHDLDFTGATFDGGDFSNATFTGGEVTFDRAGFTGGEVTFDRAGFTGGRVNLDGAEFTGGRVTRDGEDFRGSPPSPEPAEPDRGQSLELFERLSVSLTSLLWVNALVVDAFSVSVSFVGVGQRGVSG